MSVQQITKQALLVTEKEKRLLEILRRIKHAKDIPVTVVDGEPTEIGMYREVTRL
jgi:hypothetical protein